MDKGLIAKATITIDAPIESVWNALITPDLIKRYMFGTNVVSAWKEGSSIVWKGIWKDKPYEDKGTILKVVPFQLLQYTHFSPLAGVPDVPENYHTLTYELSDKDGHTSISLSQDNNKNENERKHSLEMWEALLAELKKVVESKF